MPRRRANGRSFDGKAAFKQRNGHVGGVDGIAALLGRAYDDVAIHARLWLPICALVFSTLVGVVSGVYLAVQAASLDPIAALKYE